MTRIGLFSDTHSYLDLKLFEHFEHCDEVWHAGDVGTVDIIDKLKTFKPLRIVHGNIDNREIQYEAPENLYFEVEKFQIWMTHIGGAPPRYNPAIRKQLQTNTPHIFVCGHSHILRVIRDPALNQMLYLNPGAAGREGFHKVRTVLRFVLDNGKISQMEVIELGKRG